MIALPNQIGDKDTPDSAGADARQADPLGTTIGNIVFSVAESECKDAASRGQGLGDNLAAWLIAEWEREQRQRVGSG